MRILVAGAGFVGEALADRLHGEGHEVLALTHAESSAARMQEAKGYAVRSADIGDPHSLARVLEDRHPETIDAVVHCASSGRGGVEAYRHVYLEGCRNLRRCLPRARLLFTSSTSVYAQTDGSWVDETSPAEPERATGRVLRDSEDLVLAGGGTVVRSGGIYGPGRSYLLLKFLTGDAVIEGDGGRWINQAHRTDIVSGLDFLLSRPETAGIFNLVDSNPQMQRELYESLAAHFARPLPPPAPPDYECKRGWTDKRVSNAKLRQLGWELVFPSFQEALARDPELLPSIEALAAGR